MTHKIPEPPTIKIIHVSLELFFTNTGKQRKIHIQGINAHVGPSGQ